MENIGDYIYLILLAIFALSGLFGKKDKKKKAEQKRKSIFDELPKSWEEFEEMATGKPQEQTEPPKPVAAPRPAYSPIPKPTVKPATQSRPFGSAEEIASPEYETTGYENESYDSISDFSKLRAKKQVKESISKSHTTLKVVNLETENAAGHAPIEISLDTADEARKAFLYSEIFQRKY